jgi:hypothetical protein
MLDRSTEGLSVRIAHSLSAGTLVQVRLEDSVVLGEVRYCERAGDAFRIGIRIESSLPLANGYEPERDINPKAIDKSGWRNATVIEELTAKR